MELLFPYSEGGVLAELHTLAGDLEREDRAEGVVVRARIPAALVHRFSDFARNGVGPGSGGGYGPGEGGNTGGGPRHEGGGGPGGGGGGTDYNRIFSGKDVTSKARVLEKPEPTYTEAARKNQITGTVTLRAVFSSGGQVTNIHAVSGLPDGLTERAIAAAKMIRFVPATKDGHPVSMWMELQYNFNLY